MSDIGSGISAGPQEPEDAPIAAPTAASGSDEEKDSDNASSIRDGVLRQGQRSAEVVSQYTKSQPISSLVIAFAAGFILGHFIGRR
jgi:ElaB/YqjD/DUF883 family membrane-anchored ribosome-binding protein